MNHLDELTHDWGWWNRVYTRLLIRSRGYQLRSMRRTLPAVETVAELLQHENGALLWLEPHRSFHDLKLPQVALGARANEVLDYYQREFKPREDRPWIAYFRQPVLYGRQFSILDSRRHAFEECFTRDRRWRDAVPKPKNKITPRAVAGTYLLAGTEFHNHYAHLFCDVLPRLKLFDEAALIGHSPALLPPPSHSFAHEAWEQMGLTRDGAVWDDTCWKVDGLFFASPFKQFCSWTPEAAEWIRAKLAPRLAQQPPGKRRFYISRSGGARAIENESEIIQVLTSMNFDVVQPEKLTLRQQIDLFADAGFIAGAHGAGIQNALWAPRGCRVLELVNVGYFSGIYWTLADSLNQPYGFVAGESTPGGNPFQDGYTCNSHLVRQAVDLLDRSA